MCENGFVGIIAFLSPRRFNNHGRGSRSMYFLRFVKTGGFAIPSRAVLHDMLLATDKRYLSRQSSVDVFIATTYSPPRPLCWSSHIRLRCHLHDALERDPLQQPKIKTNQRRLQHRLTYFLPLVLPSLSFNTFLTIFCSSIKNARTIRSRTQLPHREPPYARRTVF